MAETGDAKADTGERNPRPGQNGLLERVAGEVNRKGEQVAVGTAPGRLLEEHAGGRYSRERERQRGKLKNSKRPRRPCAGACRGGLFQPAWLEQNPGFRRREVAGGDEMGFSASLRYQLTRSLPLILPCGLPSAVSRAAALAAWVVFPAPNVQLPQFTKRYRAGFAIPLRNPRAWRTLLR